MASNGNAKRTIRFAVVGLGHFAQTAILPAFAGTKKCELVALFSNDGTKLDELKRKYHVKHALPYEGYDELLRSGAVDAVYIALPNDMHCDFTVRAAAAHVHVLCEKPMAINSEECERMITACDAGKVKLMIAYRLHFEEANLSTIELLNSGKLGEARYFTSAFSQQVTEGNIRTKAEHGGGPVFDIGIYCINAVRYLFRAEPTEVFAYRASKAGDERFREISEQMSVVMQFPDQRLASFICGFGASKESFYDVVCTDGRLRLDPAYDHARDLYQEVRFPDGKVKTTKFKKRDQIAAELVYFADCINKDKAPEPSGREGLADLRVIEAIHQSARTKYAVPVRPIAPKPRPSLQQEHKEPPHDKPETVHVQSPSH
jgi:glucose-fructose oxidoreductase